MLSNSLAAAVPITVPGIGLAAFFKWKRWLSLEIPDRSHSSHRRSSFCVNLAGTERLGPSAFSACGPGIHNAHKLQRGVPFMPEGNRPVVTSASIALISIGTVLPAAALAQLRGQPIDEEIIVTSSRIAQPQRETGVAISVVSAEEIQLRGYTSVTDLLRTQPGIGVSKLGASGQATAVRIRGEESYRTLLLIDGIEVTDPSLTQAAADFSHVLATSDLDRVEILRGPQGFAYGADAGGVINLQTRTGLGEPTGQVALEVGQFDTRQLDASLSSGSDSGDYFISVSDYDTDGFNTRTDDAVLMDEDGYANTTLHTKLGWHPSENLRLQVVVRDVDARTEFDQCGFPTTHDCVADTQQTTLRLSAEHAGEALSHLLAYSTTEITRANFADGAEAFTTDGELARIEYTGSYRPGEAAAFVFGLDLDRHQVLTTDGQRLERDQDAFYLEYHGRFSDRFYVTAGARRDSSDDFGTVTSARVTAAYFSELTDGASLKYRIGYGTGFRAPSLSELAYNRGPFAFPPAAGVDLSQESSGGYDIGMEYTSASGLRLEATYFDQQIEDEIFFDLSGFSGYLQASGPTQSQGVELAAQIPVTAHLTLQGNLSVNDTENTDGLQRIRRPERVGNLGAIFMALDSRLRLIANYRMSSDAVDELFGIGRVALEDYDVLDVSAVYSWTDKIELFGRIENALDEDYAEVAGYLTPGRTASAGLRIRL